MLTYNSYKFRIYPTPEQEEVLFKTIGCARKIYNLMLDKYNELYSQYKSGVLSKKEYNKQKAALNPSYFKRQKEFNYLSEVDSRAVNYAHKNVNKAFNNFFHGRANKPQFKSKNKSKWSYRTCRMSRTSKGLRLENGGKLYLPKMPRSPIKVVVSQNPVGTLVSATIEKTRSHKWFVSLMYEHHITAPVYPKTVQEMTNPVGIDMGIKDLAITSNGEVFENLRHAYKAKKKLAKLDRALSRKREQAKKDGRKLEECKNYQKTKIKRARAYEKVKNQREDALHKITTQLVKTHDFVAVENLSASNLMKHHHFAFAVADVSWNSFFTKLKYKARRQGAVVHTIDRYYASTQTCSSCGERSGPRGQAGLSVREWTCAYCTSTHDRDVNAAKNILAQGLTEFTAVGTTV